MPLTNPNDYPSAGGVDPRDENHPMFPKKPTLRIFLKPLSQKIIEQYLWLEVFAGIMILILGIAEVCGRALSSGWYVILGVILALVSMKFLKREGLLKKDEPVLPANQPEPEIKK